MTPEQIERLQAAFEVWPAPWEQEDIDELRPSLRALLAEWKERGREIAWQEERNANNVRAYTEEIKQLKKLIRRLALALIDANRLDYPWKAGSRASNALDEAETLVGEGEKP